MPTYKLPTARQAARGVGPAVDNAWTHIHCAETLHEAGYLGAAFTHLVVAVEEAVKARVLYRWPALAKTLTTKQLRELLHAHPVRHEIAQLDSMPQALRLEVALWRLDHPGTTPTRANLTRLFVRHPEAFPVTWAKNAELERQRGMHVDWDGRSWRSPADFREARYNRRFARCLEFVVKTTAVVGMFDEIEDELAESGWDISQDRDAGD